MTAAIKIMGTSNNSYPIATKTLRHEETQGILSETLCLGVLVAVFRGALIFCSCVALMTTGCSKQQNENQKEIIFWALGAEGETVQQLLPEFEKKNPGIKVIVQSIPWTAAQEKLISAYASENLPDIFQIGNTWVPQFAALNAIENLNGWVENSSIKKSNYFEGIWDTNLLDEGVFGLPWYIDTRVLFYRRDIFEKAGYNHPPRTWDELYDVSKKIKSYWGKEKKYAIYIPTNEWANFVIFGIQNGEPILKENNCYGNFSNEEFKKGFKYLIKFHKESLAPTGIAEVTNIYQAFAEGFIAMYISGPWNVNEFSKWMKGDLKDEWGTAALPAPDSSYPGASLAGGSSLVMNQKSKHKKDVWKLMEYLSKPETQIEFYRLLYNLPAVKSAWDEPLIKQNTFMKAFHEQFFNVVATPKIPEWEQIAFSKIQQYAEFAARNKLSVDEALKKLDEDVNIILEKRRWMLSR